MCPIDYDRIRLFVRWIEFWLSKSQSNPKFMRSIIKLSHRGIFGKVSEEVQLPVFLDKESIDMTNDPFCVCFDSPKMLFIHLP